MSEAIEDYPGHLKEAGRRGGIVSGEVRRAKAARRKEQEQQVSLAQERFDSEAEEMAVIVLRAAKGMGEFVDLRPSQRAQYALKALEYSLGRPRQGEKKGEEKAQEPGLSFKASPQGDFLPKEEGADAVRESEAAEVDVREQAGDGEEMVG